MGRLPGSTFMPTAERGRDADLFAYPLVGPNIKAFISLVKEFPKTLVCGCQHGYEPYRL
jgi:hypothetical protein